MGKSARSKSKIRNRNVLRATLFGPHEAERIQRLATKQQVTAGSTADLMDDDEPTKQTETKTQPPAQLETGDDVSMADASTSSAKKPAKRGKRKVQRIIVRNKKGRILSKTGVAWVKQKRFKN
ncbi:hypothetical protein IWW50_002963 [Coemansia erecta]|nr:hypothetical protein GGF43_002330 [Coemansia sp. RSA 2618]KAJ2825182.1 hypothetical protein IWW50_002963 [Coemansia erecta]